MSDILLENPPVQTSAPTYSPDQANSVFKDDTTPKNRPEPKAAPVEQKPSQVEKPKDNAAIDSAGKKKGPLDKIGAVKTPVEEVAAPVIDTKAKPPTKEENLAILRERAEKAERELGTLKPAYEKYEKELKPAYETTAAELAALKAKGLNEEERNEFSRLREMNAVEAVKRSAEFQQKILAPIQKKVANIQSKAANAKLNPQATSALMDACDIEDDWQRAKAIRGIFQGEELEPEDYKTLADSVIATANDLNENWYPKHDEALAKAEEVQVAARARQAQQGQEMSQKQEADMKKAHEEVYSMLSTDSLKPVFEDHELVVEGTTLAEALKNPAKASTPQEMAAQEQLAAAAPFLIQYANKALQKLADIERANKARNGASTSRTDGGTKPQIVDGEKPLTAEEVFQGRGKNYLG